MNPISIVQNQWVVSETEHFVTAVCQKAVSYFETTSVFLTAASA